MNEQRLAVNRRRFLECFSAAGLGLMPGALMAVAQDATQITLEMHEAAQRIAGLSFTRDQQEKILARLNSRAGPLAGFDALRVADLGKVTARAMLYHNIRNCWTVVTAPAGVADNSQIANMVTNKWGCVRMKFVTRSCGATARAFRNNETRSDARCVRTRRPADDGYGPL